MTLKMPQQPAAPPPGRSFTTGRSSNFLPTLIVSLVCVISLVAALRALLADTHMRADACRYAFQQTAEIQTMMRDDKHHLIPRNFKIWIVENMMKAEGFLLKNCPKGTEKPAEGVSGKEILNEFLKSMVQ